MEYKLLRIPLQMKWVIFNQSHIIQLKERTMYMLLDARYIASRLVVYLSMISFASIVDINNIDSLYMNFLSDPNLFVLEVIKYVHECVDENLSSVEECKKLVYKYDVINVLDIWEGQAQCSRGKFPKNPTYLDYVFVPIFLEVFYILETKYNIELKKNKDTGCISMDDEKIPWQCIFFRNCFE